MSEATDLACAKERLAGYMTHVPPSVNQGSYNLSVDFKASVAAARKVLAKRGATTGDLAAAIRSLHRYWEVK